MKTVKGVKSMWRTLKLGWIASIAAAFLCQGCGSGEYNRRMDKSLKDLKSSSVFNVLFGPGELKGTPVTVRMPKSFADPAIEPKVLEAGAANLVDPLQPVVKLSGLKTRWANRITDADGTQISYYAYLAAAKVDPAGKPMDRQLSEQISTAFPQASGSWQELQCAAPGGGTIRVKRMTVNGSQPFECIDKDAKTQTKNLPSSFDVFLYTTPSYDVVIAWAVPTAIAEQANLEQLKLLSAGSISVP